MTKSKTLFTLITSLFLFVLSFVSLPVYGSTPTDPVILTRQEYNELLMRFEMLNNTINEQLKIIDELEQQLNVAQMSTSESKQELIESMNLVNSQEHIRAARENAVNAKRIVGEGERILRNADERTQKNQDATKE